MRAWLLLSMVLAGCSEKASSAASGRSTAQFVSFGWHWTGLGSGGSFKLDSACRLESSGRLSYSVTARSGSGVVPATECEDFKKLVVSDAVMAAYELHGGEAGTCTGATDDYIDSTIELQGGDKRVMSFANGSGCGSIEPFVTLVGKMKALSDAYAAAPGDAGTDAPTDAKSYPASDFESFHWGWTGLYATHGSFDLDRDCAFVGGGNVAPVTSAGGSGTVPAAECESFKTFLLSASVVSASSRTDCGATDDYVDATIQVKGEAPIVLHYLGCSYEEPFKTIIDRMHTIATTYSTHDAGSD